MLTDPHAADGAGKMIRYATAQKGQSVSVRSRLCRIRLSGVYRQVDAQQTPIGSGPLAFPGAEGYGAYARGGRGGKVLFVT
jgi:hypothetical protein